MKICNSAHHIVPSHPSRVSTSKVDAAQGAGVSRRDFLRQAGALGLGTFLATAGCGGDADAERAAKKQEAVDARLILLRDKHGAQNFGKYEVEYEAALYSGLTMDEAKSNQRKVLENMCGDFLGDKNIPSSIEKPEDLWISLIGPFEPKVMNDLEKLRFTGRINEAVLRSWITVGHGSYLNNRLVEPNNYDGVMPNTYNLHQMGSCKKEIIESSLSSGYKNQILNDNRYFEAVNNANIGTVKRLESLIKVLASDNPNDAKVESFLEGLKEALDTSNNGNSGK